jgi:molybdopterin molybdotransferase
MKTNLSVDDALAMIRASCPRLPVQHIALAEGFGRVLAAAIHAPRSLPPFDNAAMDGFALRFGDHLARGDELAVMAEQTAGDGAAHQQLGACSIMTGARMPDGLDSVIALEDCEVLSRDQEGRAAKIRLTAPPRGGQHVRRAGEDVSIGACILQAGTWVSDEMLMVLRGIGIGELPVYRRPRLAIACTGRELVDVDGATLESGQITNTNGPYLSKLLSEAGAEVVECLTIADDPVLLGMHCQRWFAAGVELIVSTGAVSMGRHDFVPDLLRDLGATLHFHRLRMRPGKPLLFASRSSDEHTGRMSSGTAQTLIFGLPGNPISSVVGARFFVTAAIRALTGQAEEVPLQLPLAQAVRKKPGMTMIQKAAIVINNAACLEVQLLSGQESFKTAPMLAANAWVVLPELNDSMAAGTLVHAFPLRAPLRAGVLPTIPTHD